LWKTHFIFIKSRPKRGYIFLKKKLFFLIYLFIYFIFPLYKSVTNLAFVSVYSDDNNESICNLTVNKLKLEWKWGGGYGKWVGTVLNVEVSSGIYRMFDVFFYLL
jgi:hypothetical protein